MTRYKIAFYCPDQHIEYSMKTLQNVGVGGGITARTQIAHALQKNGHEVSMYVNFQGNEKIEGVNYGHFSRIKHLDTDILVLSTSGGQLDLGAVHNMTLHAKLVVLMLSGVEFPKNIIKNDFDFVYVPSNFMAATARDQWKIRPECIFTVNYGVLEENFKSSYQRGRDERKLVYLSHPSKGLEPALAVLRVLRKTDPRFTLHVYGGNKLWGESEEDEFEEPGVVYHGLVGQQELARSISQCGFSLNLQTREEPFGIIIVESMKAGCITLASPVGAYPELISHGVNGFLVSGDPVSPKTIENAAALILDMLQEPEHMRSVRASAMSTPMNWQTLAKAWEGHWDWYLNGREGSRETRLKGCDRCDGELLLLADGLHCIECGNYQQSGNSIKTEYMSQVREM